MGKGGKVGLGIAIVALVFAVFGTPTIIFRYKPVKVFVEGQMIPNTEYVSSNPVLFWVFLSLFIVALIGLPLILALKQRK